MSKELEMAKLACRALDDKKGKDINVDETLGRAGYEAKQIEGTRNSSWVLMDYGDMIVHVFDEENRLFYDLDRIWRDGKVLDINEFLEK